MPDSYNIRYVNGGDCKSESLWSLLGRNGKKAGVINVPMTYPPDAVNGVMHAELEDLFHRVSDDASVGAILLRGVARVERSHRTRFLD